MTCFNKFTKTILILMCAVMYSYNLYNEHCVCVNKYGTRI